jgi:hypothetical protein
MTKFLSTLMIGTALLGAAPALAGNELDVIQQGGGINTIDARQSGRDNSFASSQEGLDNLLKLRQRGRNNDAEAFQDGLFNEVDVKQRRRR